MTQASHDTTQHDKVLFFADAHFCFLIATAHLAHLQGTQKPDTKANLAKELNSANAQRER